MGERSGITRRRMLEGSAALTAGLAMPTAAILTPSSPWTLWYRQPAERWTEALPVGNGRIGAMVFGGVGRERLQLNEATLWSGGPYNPVNSAAHDALPEVRRLIWAGRYAEAEALANQKVMATPLSQMAYQPVGELLLDMLGITSAKVEDYRRELDLDAAVATTMFVVNRVQFRREVLASPVDQVIAIRISADTPGAIDLNLSFSSGQAATATATGDLLKLQGTGPADHGVAGALRFEAQARVFLEGGSSVTSGDRLEIRAADAVTILVAMATNYRGFNDLSGDPDLIVNQQIAHARSRSFAAIAADATAEHRRLFRRISLDLGVTPAAALPTDERIRAGEHSDDPALATLYFHYGRYLLISSSRAPGQPANLQGLWNESTRPPWGSKYTININTEMNYWPAEPTALAECAEPLIAMVREMAVSGTRTAREMYGARGWVAHHNTDLWRATAPIDGAQYGLWPMGGAWLCTPVGPL